MVQKATLAKTQWKNSHCNSGDIVIWWAWSMSIEQTLKRSVLCCAYFSSTNAALALIPEVREFVFASFELFGVFFFWCVCHTLWAAKIVPAQNYTFSIFFFCNLVPLHRRCMGLIELYLWQNTWKNCSRRYFGANVLFSILFVFVLTMFDVPYVCVRESVQFELEKAVYCECARTTYHTSDRATERERDRENNKRNKKESKHSNTNTLLALILLSSQWC